MLNCATLNETESIEDPIRLKILSNQDIAHVKEEIFKQIESDRKDSTAEKLMIRLYISDPIFLTGWPTVMSYLETFASGNLQPRMPFTRVCNAGFSTPDEVLHIIVQLPCAYLLRQATS